MSFLVILSIVIGVILLLSGMVLLFNFSLLMLRAFSTLPAQSKQYLGLAQAAVGVLFIVVAILVSADTVSDGVLIGLYVVVGVAVILATVPYMLTSKE